MRVSSGDFAGDGERIIEGCLGKFGDQSDICAFTSIKHPSGIRQFTSNIGPHEAIKNVRTGHVRDDSPVHLTHGKLRIRVRHADVGSKGDLESSSERMALHRCNHRHFEFLPHPAHLLAKVRQS